METREKLSVIIPMYNAGRYLAECAASVRAQNWPGELEIIAVDDGSADNSASLAEELGLKVIRKENGGAGSARNAGFAASHGELILFHDADDLLADGALEALYALLAEDPELAASIGKAADFVSPELSEEEKKGLAPQPEGYGALTGCVLMRRSVLDTVGLFDERLRTGETVDWLARLRDSGLKTKRADKLTKLRRIHTSNTGRTDRRAELANYAAIIRKRMKK